MLIRLSVVISFSKDDSADLLGRTLQAFAAQEKRERMFHMHLNVWCASGGEAVRGVLGQLTDSLARGASILEYDKSFLDALPLSLSRLEDQTSTHVMLARCGILPKPGCLALLVDEIGDNAAAAITACGYRLFPHEKLSSPIADLKECVHYKFYSESRPGRAVHVFTPDFCCLGSSVLKSVAGKLSEDGVDIAGFAPLWCSFVMGHVLGVSIWKVRMENALDLSTASSLDRSLVSGALSNVASFENFYQLSYDSIWPMGVTEVYYNREKMTEAKLNQETCQRIWQRGFAGVNMQSEPASTFDFAAATSCGVRVIRVGAVGGAEDLMYLVDTSSTSVEQDRDHLLRAMPRLRHSLIEIGNHGMKAIITIVDLPGCPFFSLGDGATMPFWNDKELRLRATKFWGLMAENLIDLRHMIMAYDLINEPFTQEDLNSSYFDDTPTAHMDTLNDFYRETVREIRLHDRETAIMLKPTWYASPFAMDMLQPLPDPNIKYGFHCYIPTFYALNRDPVSYCKYPGEIPKFPKAAYSETIFMDKSFLRQFLYDHVVLWQKKHSVPSHQMCVGEFGICREIPGAQEYLTDLVDIFAEFGWSWLLFSFRDEEWDALDYELGGNLSNMLYRSNCDMFHSVAKNFR